MKLNAIALLILCLCVSLGLAQDNEPPDNVKKLIERAIQDDAEAQYKLGVCYANGDGLSKDTGESGKWYRLAAYQGHADAQVQLGFYYSVGGHGFPKDDFLAYKWFCISAQQGNEKANIAGKITESNLTATQIAEAQRLSCEWMEKHKK